MGQARGVVRFKRVLAALDALARDATPVRLERLMGFLRLLMDDVASDPARFAAHIGGNLVVDFRRNYWWATLVIVADDGRVFSDVFARTLPFVSYESIIKFVESEASPLGPAFVLMSDDLVSASVLEEVVLEDEACAAPPALLFDDTAETAVVSRWDTDATIICPPPSELLAHLASLERR